MSVKTLKLAIIKFMPKTGLSVDDPIESFLPYLRSGPDYSILEQAYPSLPRSPTQDLIKIVNKNPTNETVCPLCHLGKITQRAKYNPCTLQDLYGLIKYKEITYTCHNRQCRGSKGFKFLPSLKIPYSQFSIRVDMMIIYLSLYTNLGGELVSTLVKQLYNIHIDPDSVRARKDLFLYEYKELYHQINEQVLKKKQLA